MARFIITTIPHPIDETGGLREIETTIVAPKRESRAIRAARRLKAQGNQDVMLFRHDGKSGRYLPVSLKHKEYREGRHSQETGFNTRVVGIPVDVPAKYTGIRGGIVHVGGNR